MIVHGYGLSTRESPDLMFSNVLWGKAIMALPKVGNIPGYSLASFAALSLAASAILYFLLRLQISYTLSCLIMILLLARATLFPQFTINAGLLTVAAVVGWQVYPKNNSNVALSLSFALAFLGYLVRGQEFFLVIAVAAPFVPWRSFGKDWRMKTGFLLLLCAVFLAAGLDTLAYAGPEWKSYRELNAARAPYTDFQAGEFVKKRPDVMARYGYSQNDINLIDNWFFADPTIANAHSLTAMLEETGWRRARLTNAMGGIRAMKSPFLSDLVPLTALVILFLVLNPEGTLLLSAAIYLCATFTLGVVGRAAPARVGFALIAILLTQGLVCRNLRPNVRPIVLTLVCFLACVVNLIVLLPKAVAEHKVVEQAQENIRDLPTGSFIAWGSDFPYEAVFPPFRNSAEVRRLRIYPLGVFTRAPFSVAATEENVGFGLVKRLRSPAGLPVIAAPASIDLLRTYCAEHWEGKLKDAEIIHNRSFTVRRLWCE
jgi:hypothetical protein